MSTVYQKIMKKAFGKDVEDAYPTEFQKVDKSKPLTDQIALNETAVNMGTSAGAVGAKGLRKIEEVAAKIGSKPLTQAERIKTSRNPILDIKKEQAMDVLGAKKAEKIVPVNKGGQSATKESRMLLHKKLQESKSDPLARERLKKVVGKIIKARK